MTHVLGQCCAHIRSIAFPLITIGNASGTSRPTPDQGSQPMNLDQKGCGGGVRTQQLSGGEIAGLNKSFC